MAIRLHITEGGDADALEFDGPEVSIGRTADNDLVLNDASVSRRHAQLKLLDDGWVIEDLGSGNGTIVNGAKIDGPFTVAAGDNVTIGPVTFTIDADEEAAGDDGDEEVEDEEDTGAEDEEDDGGGRNGSRALARRPGGALAKGSSFKPRMAPAKFTGGKPSPLAKKKSDVGLPSASERAREARAALSRSPLQRFGDWFRTRPLPIRILLVLFVVVTLGAVVAAAVGKAKKQRIDSIIAKRDKSKEVFPVGASKAEAEQQAFGNGGSVDVQCMDKCNFSFDFVEPEKGRARAVVHFIPCLIAKEHEVQILANDVFVKDSPAAVGGCLGEVSQILPRQNLRPNTSNIVTFDNKRIPGPGSNEREWMVKGIWVETEPIPEPDFQLAKQKYDLGLRAEQLELVGTENLYTALRHYRDARLYLEGLDQKPDLYDAIQGHIREVEKKLDKACSKDLFSAQRFRETGDWKKSEEVLKTVMKRFGPDHKCYQEAQKMLEE